MTIKRTDERVALARLLLNQGRTRTAVAAELGIAPKTLRDWLAEAPPLPVVPPEPPIPVDDIIAEAKAALETDTTDEGVLDMLIRDTTRRQAIADTEAGRTSLTRLLMQLVERRYKMRPTPPPNPNDNPLVKLSAELCIAKLHELLDRV